MPERPRIAMGSRRRAVVAAGLAWPLWPAAAADDEVARLLREGGALTEARTLWRRLAPITQAAFAEPNPAVIKGALARQGWLADVLRAPMLPAAPDNVTRLLAAADRY